MSLPERRYYKLKTTDLAIWLRQQGDSTWWSVDGDPLLTGLVSFPCPSNDLADQVDKLRGDLLVEDPDTGSTIPGDRVEAAQLDKLADHDEANNRLFLFHWADSPPEDLGWLLLEDREMAESGSTESIVY